MSFKRSTLRYGDTPEPVTPYQKAAQVWDERIGSARIQAHNWRLAALRSSPSTYMASVSWTYPASQLLALKKQRTEADLAAAAVADTGVNINELRFRYRIEGDAPWKPRQVFDDGAKVYIQFPSGLAQSEAPPLFVIGPDGKPALVNYRVRGTTYVVDRLFAAAELRLGTAPQRVVRIVRTDAVWRETRK